jgi:hypothetical protein
MGEKQSEPFQLSFNASLKVDVQGSRVTSNGGLVLVPELDERSGLGELIGEKLVIRGAARIRSFRWPTCFASPFTAAWRDTRMLMTPSGSRKIPPSG